MSSTNDSNNKSSEKAKKVIAESNLTAIFIWFIAFVVEQFLAWVFKSRILMSSIILLLYIIFIIYAIMSDKYKLVSNSRVANTSSLLILPFFTEGIILAVLYIILYPRYKCILHVYSIEDIIFICFNGFVLLSLLCFFFFDCQRRIEIEVRDDNCCISNQRELHNITNDVKSIQTITTDVKKALWTQSPFVYTVTCIPFSQTADIVNICLINNQSHSESSWMFPGGHINIYGVDEQPEDILRLGNLHQSKVAERVKIEAGIEILHFLSSDGFSDGISIDECTDTFLHPIKPAFTYVLKVSNKSKCYSERHHRYHYDFTFVGKYSSSPNEHAYDVCIIPFVLSNFKFDAANENDEIRAIEGIILKSLNEQLRPRKPKAKHTALDGKGLFLSSIPDMIYQSLKLISSISQ